MKISNEERETMMKVKLMSKIGYDNEYFKTEQNEEDGTIMVYFNDNVISLVYDNTMVINAVTGLEINDDYCLVKLNDLTEIPIIITDGFLVLSKEIISDENAEKEEVSIMLKYNDYPKHIVSQTTDSSDFPIINTKVEPMISPMDGKLQYVGYIDGYMNYSSLLPINFMVTKFYKNSESCLIDLLSIEDSLYTVKNKLNKLFNSTNNVLLINHQNKMQLIEITSFTDFYVRGVNVRKYEKDEPIENIDVPYSSLLEHEEGWKVIPSSYLYMYIKDDYYYGNMNKFVDTKEKVQKLSTAISQSISKLPDTHKINYIHSIFMSNNADKILSLVRKEDIEDILNRITVSLKCMDFIFSDISTECIVVLVDEGDNSNLIYLNQEFEHHLMDISTLFKEYFDLYTIYQNK